MESQQVHSVGAEVIASPVLGGADKRVNAWEAPTHGSPSPRSMGALPAELMQDQALFFHDV